MSDENEEFERWWAASKYCQVVYDDPNRKQIAFDGWKARSLIKDEHLTMQELNLIRQWFNAVSDVIPKYLTLEDKILVGKIKKQILLKKIKGAIK